MITFPRVETMQDWIILLEGETSFFVPIELPEIGLDWYQIMYRTVETTQIEYRLLDESLDVFDIAARIYYKIANNHSLVNGNKRSAVICTYLFLILNGIQLVESPEEVARFSVQVVTRDTGIPSESYPYIKEYLQKKSMETDNY